ncbi:hypothetical protein HMPREF1146_1632 [Prevotella sp. MSX73]|nr:hypothetical protein HMPREF1146_1632 [Prevotella sp. MSX73]
MFGSKVAKQIEESVAPLLERIAALETANTDLKEQVESLAAKIDVCCERIDKLESALSGQYRKEEMMLDVSEAIQNEQGDDHSYSSHGGKTELFAGAPTIDGLFSDVAKKERIGKSLYKLVTADGATATFEMLDTPDALATAMISLSQFVKPVCKIEGNTTGLLHHVTILERGSAVMENGVWRVIKKAMVRFG